MSYFTKLAPPASMSVVVPASRLLRVVGAALRSSLRRPSVALAPSSLRHSSLACLRAEARSHHRNFAAIKNHSTLACPQEATRSTVAARSHHADYAVDRSSASTARARGRADTPRQQRREGEKNYQSGVERMRDDTGSCSKHIGRGANAAVIFLDAGVESTHPAREDSSSEPCSYGAISHVHLT